MKRKPKEKMNYIEAAFSEWVIPLQRFTYNIVRNNHDAEDLVADTFVRILEYIDTYNAMPEKALCFAIARNLSLDYLRRRKRIRYHLEQNALAEVEDDVNVFEEVQELLALENIDELIHRLPEIYSNVFYLKFTMDMSFFEIGSIMDVSESYARVLYFRARSKMKKIWIEEREGE